MGLAINLKGRCTSSAWASLHILLALGSGYPCDSLALYSTQRNSSSVFKNGTFMRNLPNFLLVGIVAVIVAAGYVLAIHLGIRPARIFSRTLEAQPSEPDIKAGAKAASPLGHRNALKLTRARGATQIQESMVPEITIKMSVIPEPHQIPGQASTLIGMRKSELRANFGQPELTTAQREGHMLETFFYVDKFFNVKAVRLKDGVVADVQEASPVPHVATR